MEGTITRRKSKRSPLPKLALQQEFVGGRLERQWCSRAYELITPIVYVMAGRVQVVDSAGPLDQKEVMVTQIAKGA